MRFWIISFATILFLSACSSDNKRELSEQPLFDLTTVKQQITLANEKYNDRFVNADSALYVERYTVDAAIFPAENPIVKGRQAIMNYYYNGGVNKEFTIVITAIDIYGTKDLVVEEGLYDFPDGKGGSYDKGKFIALWKMEEGVWKLYREIWNADKPLGD
jgi:ketosteroid isomerase-like protein